MNQLVTLNIRGMTCASCVARLEKSLSKVAGVDAASVNLATEKAQIRVNQEPQVITSLLICLLYTSPSPRDVEESRMPSSA